MDDHLREHGAETILTMGEGDDLAGQEESFKEWTKNVFKVILVLFKSQLTQVSCPAHMRFCSIVNRVRKPRNSILL